MKKHNQKGLSTKISPAQTSLKFRRAKEIPAGFGLIEALLIIIAAGIVGFGGYWVWHTQHKTKPATTSSTTDSQNSTSASTQQYLTIKEWGVKIKLSSNTPNLYTEKTSQQNALGFRAKELDNLYPGCGDNTFIVQSGLAVDKYIGHIGMSKPFAEAYQGLEANTFHLKVGDRYFIQNSPSPSVLCSSGEDSMHLSEKAKQERAFVDTIKQTVAQMEAL